MRFLEAPTTLLPIIATFLFLSQPSIAKPYPSNGAEPDEHMLQNTTYLELVKRCAGTTCGYYGQLCCTNGASCYTDSSGQAQCGAAGNAVTTAASNGGYWQYYTSTWVETNLITKTAVYSSYLGVATVAATSYAAATTTGLSCAWNQSPCNSCCCNTGYYCLSPGQCVLNGGGTSVANSATASAGLRPTSSTLVVVTQTQTPTTTVPFTTPVATGANVTVTSSEQSSGGLSAGAIAGIVIGVIAGIIILFLLCLLCCFKAGWDAIAAIFGLGKKRRTREEYVEEHYHHSSGGGGADRRRWYGGGDRPSRPERRDKGGWAGLGAVGLGLAGLTAWLGLKRRRDDRNRRSEKSDSYYSGSSYDYYTSESKFSPHV